MKHRTRILAAGMLGNLVEAFDIAICGLLVVYIAKYLVEDSAKGFMVVFGTILVGYLARPIGAMLLGAFSDKYGRKITLAASILIMGIATALIGVIPSYQTLGVGSAVILLLLRITQSFVAGAEYLNASVYLVENSEATQKGFSGSWASFGAMLGTLIATLVAFGVVTLNKNYPEVEWLSWRIPFLLAFIGSSIGLYMRLCIPESMDFVLYYADKPKPQVTNLLKSSCNYIRQNKIKSLYVWILSSLGVSTTLLIYVYGTVQAHVAGSFSDMQVIYSNIISLSVLLLAFPIIGRLSDRLDREKIVLWASFGFLVLILPYFNLLSSDNYTAFVLCHALIAIPAAAYYATVPVILAEMFPLELRCSVLSTLYSISASLAAGLTPILSLVLLNATKSAVAPGYLIVALALAVFWVIGRRRAMEFSVDRVVA